MSRWLPSEFARSVSLFSFRSRTNNQECHFFRTVIVESRPAGPNPRKHPRFLLTVYRSIAIIPIVSL